MKVVLANGVFDILHYGHILHLRQARAMGDYLVVSLTLDDSVNKGPGRPINKWDERYEILKELRCVDSVYGTRSAVNAIRMIRPAIFVKGIDYAAGLGFTENVVAACKEVGATMRFTDTPKMSATDAILRTIEMS